MALFHWNTTTVLAALNGERPMFVLVDPTGEWIAGIHRGDGSTWEVRDATGALVLADLLNVTVAMDVAESVFRLCAHIIDDDPIVACANDREVASLYCAAHGLAGRALVDA